MKPLTGIFFKRLFLLSLTILFFWYTIDGYALATYSENDLIPFKGRLVHMDTVQSYTSKIYARSQMKYSYFRLLIDSQPAYIFTYLAGSGRSYDQLQRRVKIGDTLAIYAQPRLWGLLGPVKLRPDSSLLIADKPEALKKVDVRKLVHGKDLVIAYNKFFMPLRLLYIPSLILTLIFTFLFLKTFRVRP